jgi:hypothetical protein
MGSKKLSIQPKKSEKKSKLVSPKLTGRKV